MARRHSGRRFPAVLGIAAAAALLLAACAQQTDDDPRGDASPTPEAEEGDPVNFLDLEVGDCFDIPGNLPDGEALRYSSCDILHLYEAFAVTEMPGDAFPGASDVETAAADFCESAFTEFVGESWKSSEFDFQYIVPSERSWTEVGDRSLMCLVTTLSALPWSGTAGNGAR